MKDFINDYVTDIMQSFSYREFVLTMLAFLSFILCAWIISFLIDYFSYARKLNKISKQYDFLELVFSHYIKSDSKGE